MPTVLHPLIEDIILNRGYGIDEKENFLNPKYEDLHDPFLMKDMDKAVSRIEKAFRDKEKIAVYSDFDADGVPGGVMLKSALASSGADVISYMPDRHADGFGFHQEAVDKLHEEGVSLIITVDCGIANCDAVERANTLGIDVIITDHHESGQCVMNAIAVLDPKQPDCNYPFKGLCGTGVAFKLVQALQQKGVLNMAPGQEKWLLDLVAIATIADMVPLTGENRILAKFGLLVLNRSRRPGIRALTSMLRLRNITEDDVGFLIAPRINAASRMGEVSLAGNLLSAEDETAAYAFAKELEAVNRSRKGVVAAMVKEAHERIEELRLHESPVIVLGSVGWRPSLLGLVANNIAEKYDRPVFLWGEDGSKELRGSCRGNKSVSVHDLMAHSSDIFIQYGGHKEAGGFTVAKENLHALPDTLSSAFGNMDSVLAAPEKVFEASVYIKDITPSLLRSLFAMRPFGLENDKPLFNFPQVNLGEVKNFGKAKEHLEIMMKHGESTGRGIKFFAGAFSDKVSAGATCDVLGQIEEDPFRGRSAWRVRVVDVK